MNWAIVIQIFLELLATRSQVGFLLELYFDDDEVDDGDDDDDKVDDDEDGDDDGDDGDDGYGSK